LRSPTTRHGRSPLAIGCSRAVNDIDLNLEPYEDAPENAQSGSAQEDGADPYAHQEDENDSDTGADLQAQENARRRVVVPNEKRRAIFEALTAKARNGNLKGHETKEISEEFSVPLRTVQRIWKKGKSCLDQGLLVDVSSGKSRCGRKKMEVDVSTLRDLPMSSRTTIHDVAKHFGISKSKLHSMKREGIIKRVSNSIKPYLTDKNKKDRLKWCLSMLDPTSIPLDPVFQGLFDYVFIDEKWYFITRKTERYYTIPGEEQPTRTCKNKNYIPKIMVLAVVARPRFDTDGNCTFDGKIGCFPFVKYEPAKRSSANRPAGTIEMKPIDPVKKEVIRDFMIEKVLPAIRAKWPPEDAHKPIFIQQDNARPHLAPNDKIFCEAAKQHGFDMRLVCQPANSPDFNVLDLGFFNSIQSIQYKTTSKTTEELVAAVDQAFEGYSVHQANRIFLTLHGCMKEVMKLDGGNGYDVPHIRKGMLERQGCLPLQLKCEAQLVQAAMAHINE
jgi:hypothetical protein